MKWQSEFLFVYRRKGRSRTRLCRLTRH